MASRSQTRTSVATTPPTSLAFHETPNQARDRQALTDLLANPIATLVSTGGESSGTNDRSSGALVKPAAETALMETV